MDNHFAGVGNEVDFNVKIDELFNIKTANNLNDELKQKIKIFNILIAKAKKQEGVLGEFSTIFLRNITDLTNMLRLCHRENSNISLNILMRSLIEEFAQINFVFNRKSGSPVGEKVEIDIEKVKSIIYYFYNSSFNKLEKIKELNNAEYNSDAEYTINILEEKLNKEDFSVQKKLFKNKESYWFKMYKDDGGTKYKITTLVNDYCIHKEISTLYGYLSESVHGVNYINNHPLFDKTNYKTNYLELIILITNLIIFDFATIIK